MPVLDQNVYCLNNIFFAFRLVLTLGLIINAGNSSAYASPSGVSGELESRLNGLCKQIQKNELSRHRQLSQNEALVKVAQDAENSVSKSKIKNDDKKKFLRILHWIAGNGTQAFNMKHRKKFQNDEKLRQQIVVYVKNRFPDSLRRTVASVQKPLNVAPTPKPTEIVAQIPVLPRRYQILGQENGTTAAFHRITGDPQFGDEGVFIDHTKLIWSFKPLREEKTCIDFNPQDDQPLVLETLKKGERPSKGYFEPRLKDFLSLASDFGAVYGQGFYGGLTVPPTGYHRPEWFRRVGFEGIFSTSSVEGGSSTTVFFNADEGRIHTVVEEWREACVHVPSESD